MTSYTKQEIENAQEVIKKLRKKNGAIEPEAVQLLREHFPDALEAIENNRSTVGKLTQLSVTHLVFYFEADGYRLSKNLYSKDTRFIFELLQNADDNHYTIAQQNSELPRVSLTLSPDGFILDCNEDGFTEKNVAAVCTVAESTKAVEKAMGYIGEKGIGFKSVFRVFKKAHIQSGPFSFSFCYDPDKGESAGLDLVTPIIERHMPLPSATTTRISLSFAYGSDFDSIRRDLDEVPDTMLLFLNRIRQLEIHIKPLSQPPSSITYIRRQSGHDSAVIEQETVNAGVTESVVKKYLMARRLVDNLPVHETRKNIHTAEVLLAFPVDIDNEPQFESQYVYAFLPLQKPGFKFLIQSDFITNASREMLDNGCARNKALLAEVAQAFRSAMLSFASNSARHLRYGWTGFIPNKQTENDPFWRQLRPEILRLLQREKIVRSWTDALSVPETLSYLPLRMRDDDSQPLVPDTPSETYLSACYLPSEVAELEPLGVQVFSSSSFVTRLGAYLKQSRHAMEKLSYYRSWRNDLSACLCDIWDEESDQLSSPLHKSICQLPIVHLQSADLVSIAQKTCYWPTIKGIVVPELLDISLVNQEAINGCPAYENLLSKLGVLECTFEFVVSRIFEKYNNFPDFPNSTIVWHHHFVFKHAPEKSIKLPIRYCTDGRDSWARRLASQRLYHVYFYEQAGDLSPRTLIGPKPGIYKKVQARFLQENYLSDFPATDTNIQGRTWKSWLETRCGVRSIVQPLSPDESELSMEFKYLLSNKQADALRLLRVNWSTYQTQAQKLKEFISQQSLRTESGDKALVKDLYILTTETRREAESVGASSSLFLAMPATTDAPDQDWRFLTYLGFRFDLNLGFYLCVLEMMAGTVASAIKCEHVLQVYRALYGFVARKAKAANTIRNLSDRLNCVYLPAKVEGNGKARWLKTADCCWGGKDFLTVVKRLSSFPQYEGNEVLESFFKEVWSIRDATFDIYIDELAEMQANTLHNPDKVARVYEELLALADDDSWQDIKESIESFELVYIHSARIWVSPSQCAWVGSKIRIDGHYGISDLYSDPDCLKDFFCNVLGITEPSIKMYVKTLERAAKNKRPFTELQQSMYRVSLLNPERSDLEVLKRVSLFLIRSPGGKKSLVSAEAEFAIADREDFAAPFRNKVSMVCLELKEIEHCKSFLLALGLGPRFCSKAVIQRTQVGEHRPDADLTAKLRGLTEYILRCAAFYNAAMDESQLASLASKLQNVQAFMSDNITKYLELKQGGRTFESGQQKTTFHFTDDDSGLKIYVPEDDESRESCDNEEFPMGLLELMSVTNLAAKAPVMSILHCVYPRSIDNALVCSGVPQLPEKFKALVRPAPARTHVPTVKVRKSGSDLADSLNALHITPPRSRSASRERSATPPTPTSVVSRTTHFARRDSLQPRDVATNSAPRTPSTNRIDEFKRILERIVKSAEGSPVAEVPTSLTFSALFARDSSDRDFYVGVAGEVYLLNYLQCFGLPGFGVEHWRSGIRTLAEPHEKYRNIGRSSGRETADFVYTDTSQALSHFLENEGALPTGANVDDVVEYHIEVKTTTSGCYEKFYMSQYQVDRMQDMSMRPGVKASRLYVIARVSNIDGPNIGLKFYVDPHRMRDIIRPFHHEVDARDDVLKFSAEKWIVQAQA